MMRPEHTVEEFHSIEEMQKAFKAEAFEKDTGIPIEELNVKQGDGAAYKRHNLGKQAKRQAHKFPQVG